MSEKIQKRIFLVGAARSGTTLLQRLLAAHSEIYSFPETHFFSKTIPMRRSKRQIWRFRKKNIEIISQFFQNIGAEDSEIFIDSLNRETISLKHWIRGLLNILDEVTLRNGYTIWLEKTPSHLRYVNILEKTKPCMNYIHIIRNGEDVVASLYEVTRKHKDKWGGERTLDNCIGRWKRDITISKSYFGKQNHFFILYKELVEKPETIIQYLFEKLQLTYEEGIIENYGDESSKLVLEDENWKKDPSKKIGKRSKFAKIFNEEEQKYVKSKINDIDLSVFKILTN